MATILAANNGNWSATGTWTGGVIPTTGDIVVANSRNVTINVNIDVAQLRNDNFGGAANYGDFRPVSGVIIRANILTGSAASMPPCMTINNPCSIVGNINGGGTGGSLTSPYNGAGVAIASNVTVIISGNITGGSNLNCVGLNLPFGTAIVVGNVTGGSSASSAFGIYSPNNGGILILNSGTIRSSSVMSAINYNSISGTISGDVLGPTSLGSANSIVYANPVGILTINGTVIGSNNGTIVASVSNSSNGSIVINGTVTGGTNGSPGVLNAALGSVIINGTAIGGSGAAGVINSSTGSVFATLAKGNIYGIGSSGATHQVGISNASFGPCYVSGIEFGDRGACPVFGPIQFLNSLDNTCSMYRPSGLSKKILLDVNNVSGLLPQTIDVRKNVVYNLGNNIGSLNMPSSGSVALGVAVDNTSGIAILSNPGQIWDYDTSNISGVNSIGNRLKNCSTVENLGTQLSNALSSITP
jgi:hypothetical protein